MSTEAYVPRHFGICDPPNTTHEGKIMQNHTPAIATAIEFVHAQHLCTKTISLMMEKGWVTAQTFDHLVVQLEACETTEDCFDLAHLLYDLERHHLIMSYRLN